MKRTIRARRAFLLVLVLLLFVTIAAEAESWICPKCGTQSDGNFCPNCAEPKPQPTGDWICEKCGNACESSFNFCPNCASPRPAGTAGVKQVRLCDLHPYTYTNGGLFWLSNRSDILGNRYEWSFLIYSSKTSSTWDIGGKYSTLSATVGIDYGSRGKKYTGYIRIYGDDRMLFEAKDIASDTKSYPIEVDIRGVTDLKIEMSGGPSDTQSVGIMLAEVWLR